MAPTLPLSVFKTALKGAHSRGRFPGVKPPGRTQRSRSSSAWLPGFTSNPDA